MSRPCRRGAGLVVVRVDGPFLPGLSDAVVVVVAHVSWHLGAGRIYSIAVNGSGGNGKRCDGLFSRLSERVLRTVLGAEAGVKRQRAKPIGPAGE